MRVKHKFSFRVDEETQEIVDFLEKNEIKFKLAKGIPILSVGVMEDSPYWEHLNLLMKRHNKHSQKEKVFTNKEIREAEWMRIRSQWRWEYPQPEVEYKSITFDNGQYCDNCGCGLVQKNYFQLKKQPNWGLRNFLMINWVEDELFVNDDVVNLFNNNQISGIEFNEVLKYKNKEPMNNIKQMKVTTILNKGLSLNSDETVDKLVCSNCGTKKIILDGGTQLKFDSTVFQNAEDIVKTKENFGDGLVCSKIILISNKVYQVIQNNSLGKDLIFEPIELI